jgi:hypothetical protein
MSHRQTKRRIPPVILKEYKPYENPKIIRAIAIIIIKKTNNHILQSKKLSYLLTDLLILFFIDLKIL